MARLSLVFSFYMSTSCMKCSWNEVGIYSPQPIHVYLYLYYLYIYLSYTSISISIFYSILYFKCRNFSKYVSSHQFFISHHRLLLFLLSLSPNTCMPFHLKLDNSPCSLPNLSISIYLSICLCLSASSLTEHVLLFSQSSLLTCKIENQMHSPGT